MSMMMARETLRRVWMLLLRVRPALQFFNLIGGAEAQGPELVGQKTGSLQNKADAGLLHAETRLLVLAGNVATDDAGSDAGAVILCIKPHHGCNIKLSNLFRYVQLTHVPNMLSCAPSPRMSMETSVEVTFGYDTHKRST